MKISPPPFYNKATQQLTAPGSTFKPVTIVAGLNEGVIDNDTVINCNGLFGEGLVDKGDQLHCWLLSGHGNLDVVGAIENSCNVFLCTTAYLLGLDADGNFSQNAALEKLQQYASLFDLDQKTGVQITESSPPCIRRHGTPLRDRTGNPSVYDSPAGPLCVHYLQQRYQL